MGPRRRLHLAILAATFLLALAVRLLFWHIPAYGDEGALYYTARHLAAPASNVHDLYVPDASGLAAHAYYRPEPPVFWYRPMQFVVLSPAAQAGFDAYRLWSLTLTSLLAPLGAGLLLRHGHHPATAATAGATIATLPFLATWSVITTPDALMSCWFLGGLLAWEARRGGLVLLLFLVAAWTKESALVGMGVLLAFSLFARHRAGERPWWPLALSRRETGLAFALALGPLPLVTALWKGGYPPSAPGHEGFGWILDHVAGHPWLLVGVLAGLLFPSSRFLAGAALVYPAFYLVYEALGRFTNLWYLVLPVTLAIIGSAAGFDAWVRAVWRNESGARRGVPIAAAALAILLIGILVAGPGASFSRTQSPLSATSTGSLADAIRYEHGRDADRRGALADLAGAHPASVFTVDVYGATVLDPIASEFPQVTRGETRTVELFGQKLDPWGPAIEKAGSITILTKTSTPLNQAVRDVYADCVRYDVGDWVLIDGSACSGRGDLLAERHAALHR